MLAVLGIGTNMGNREKNLRDALDSLDLVPATKVTRTSSVWETEPWGFADQPDFYNIVAEIETELSPAALLGACLGIEAALGRIRTFKNGPRVIDIDVLLYEGTTLSSDELMLPHPRMGERAFVLVPFEELYPDGRVAGFDFSEQINHIDRSTVTETEIKL